MRRCQTTHTTQRERRLLLRGLTPVGDIHQPLHTTQLFTVEYPNGDRGGNEICGRGTQAGQPMDLHRFWDNVITSSSNLTRIRNDATSLRKPPGVSAESAYRTREHGH